MVRTATASMVALTLVRVARRAASSAVTPDGGGGVSCKCQRNPQLQTIKKTVVGLHGQLHRDTGVNIKSD